MNNTETNWQMDYPLRWKLIPEELEYKIRSCIFMIIGVSAGLPALVWSVGELIEHRRNGHRISAFIILLLLTDFTELYLSPYILIKDLLNELYMSTDLTSLVFQSLWWSSTDCGLLLNQLVALEGILSVRYPLYTAAVFSSRCFRLFFMLAFLCITVCRVYFQTDITVLSCIIAFIVLVVVHRIILVIYCRPSCSADPHFHTSRKHDPHILVIFIFNLLVFYPPIVLRLLHLDRHNLFHSPLFVRLRLISDPLLCVLVCRQNLRVETPQTHDETRVDPR